jgi:hypothetical protein
MKPRSTWHDAYDAQMGLWRWIRTAEGHRFMLSGYRESVSAFPIENIESGKQMCAAIYGAEESKLLTASPIFVSAEMCELLTAAVEGFAPEPLYATDLIAHTGFVWYETPFTIPDRYDDLVIRLKGWSWCPMESLSDDGAVKETGLAVTLYSEVPEEMTTNRYPMGVAPIHLSPWWYGMTFDGNEVDLKGNASGAAWWWRITQVTLRLMQQRIAVQHTERPDRPTRREGKRSGFDVSDEREIVVVRLRRERGETSEPSGEGANYSHRFIVGGHWRNQWYPSGQIHRQIWISPYVKGPEDKPLVVSPRRAFTWDR